MGGVRELGRGIDPLSFDFFFFFVQGGSYCHLV